MTSPEELARIEHDYRAAKATRDRANTAMANERNRRVMASSGAELRQYVDPASAPQIAAAERVLAAAEQERAAIERTLRAKYTREEQQRRAAASIHVSYARPLPTSIDLVGTRVQADARFLAADVTVRLARSDVRKLRRIAYKEARQRHYLATCKRGKDTSPRARLDRIAAQQDPTP